MDLISKQKKYLSENLIVESLRMYDSNQEDIKEFFQATRGNTISDLLYVGADGYLRKLLIAVESLCANRYYFIGNSIYLDDCWYRHTLRFLVCPNKTYLCTCF